MSQALSQGEFLDQFDGILGLQGDMFFYTGDDDRDEKYIKSVITQQGHWSGNTLKYYFDENFNFLRTEPRF